MTNKAEGTKATSYTPNFDLDKDCYELVTNSSIVDYASKVSISVSGGITFLSSIKSRTHTVSSNTNDINVDESYRYILDLTSGTELPQHLSFYYKLNFLENAVITLGGTSDAVSAIQNELSDPNNSKTTLVLRSAETLEQLFDDSNALSIQLAQEITSSPSDIVFYHKTLPKDLQNNFFRIESRSLHAPYSGIANAFGTSGYSGITATTSGYSGAMDPFAEIMIKGLRFSDVELGDTDSSTSLEKKVAVNGIVHGSYVPGIGQIIITDPKDILSNGGGVYLSPGGEIVIDFPMHIYVNEISFNVKYDGSKSAASSSSSLQFSCLPIFKGQSYGEDIVSDSDWYPLGDEIIFDPTITSTVTKDGISMYTNSIRISLNSGVVLRLSNLLVKSFSNVNDVEGSQFVVSGYVSNPELIVVDDLQGLLEGNIDGTRATGYASFNEMNSSLTVNLGDPGDGYTGIGINRISLNIAGANTTRTLSISVWDGITLDDSSNEVYDKIYTGYVLNYEYNIVNWSPESKEKSNVVNLQIMDQTQIENLSDNLAEFFRTHHNSNFSTYFDSGQLTGYSFRPNFYKDRSLVISSSTSDTTQPDFTGSIQVNCQMDEDGPFAGEIGQIGLLERNLNINFPLRLARKIKIEILNRGDSNIRMNGLKVYVPIIGANGQSVWPRSTVNWDIKLNAVSSSS